MSYNDYEIRATYHPAHLSSGTGKEKSCHQPFVLTWGWRGNVVNSYGSLRADVLIFPHSRVAHSRRVPVLRAFMKGQCRVVVPKGFSLRIVPKGQCILAQGNALGKESPQNDRALKGQCSSHSLALTGRLIFYCAQHYPGRRQCRYSGQIFLPPCPGLLCVAPDGAKILAVNEE